MRITNRMITQNAITHMSESLEQLHSLQEKNSTQKKFSSASEDPVAASLSLSLKSSLSTIEDYGKTVDLANDWMSANEMAFQKAEELSTRATTLISRALNDTYGAEERANAFAEDLNGIIREAVEAANTSQNGQYVFAGIQVGQPTPPYSIPDNATPVPTLNAAINGTVQRTVGPGKNVNLNFHADDAFGAFLTTLVNARDALLSNNMNGVNGLRDSLTALQSNLNLLDQNRTLNGARMRQVEVAQDYLEKTKIETKSLISKNEDINLAEGISLLKSQETTYQVVLEVSQRAVSTMNLFDYMN
jgi:flagellar hook-associated protein 3 FlgL